MTRRKWLSDAAHADLVALCQSLPGPASSQVGFALGLTRAGWGGALVAFLAFTLPSALILLVLALTAARIESPLGRATENRRHRYSRSGGLGHALDDCRADLNGRSITSWT